ncbi:MAG: arginine deiminase family protein [Syntrophobacterales bacterium]|jgi:dimethylargininase
MFKYAITRKPGQDFAHGIATSNLGTPSYELLLEQHSAYLETLRALRLDVIVLDPLPGYPDAYFVEDVAIVTPDVAIITNPGASSRRGEAETIESTLANYRETFHIKAPGTVDGGDVLMAGTHFFIGISGRTNRKGAEQLARILEAYGKALTVVPVCSGLHLKSSVNYVGQNTLLMTELYGNLDQFREYDKIVVDKSEEYAANTLLINGSLITPRGFPKTRKKLLALDLNIIELDVSEVRKMDGGLTCMSVRF